MGALSNLPFLKRLPQHASASPPLIRPAADNEIEAAIRVILANAAGFGGEAQFRDFVRLARTSTSAAGGLWMAVRGNQIQSAILPLVSPGRTVLLFVPPYRKDPSFAHATHLVINAACDAAAASGIQIAQVLSEVHDEGIIATLSPAGFTKLAELMYMHSPVRKGREDAPLPTGMGWKTYCAANHNVFAQTILASYQDSLDCPALNGVRNIEDVINGHRATGEFSPQLWRVLHHNDVPLGVVLLSGVPRSDAIELVYLGLTPQARGRGIADLILRHAQALVSASPYARLSLAVDAANTPALKLYWRHGFAAICRKTAMLKLLNPPPATNEPATRSPNLSTLPPHV